MIETPNRTKLKAVTRANPCEICRGNHKCSRGEDGLFMCGRSPDGFNCHSAKKGETVREFVFLGLCKGDDQFGLYRHKDDPKLSNGDAMRQWREEKPHYNLQPKKREPLESPAPSETEGASQPPTDWEALAHSHAKNLTPILRTELANLLGIPENSILPLTGYLPYEENTSQGVKETGSWTFPEYDGHGRIIGITRRWRSGDKKMISGGHRGLSIPANLAQFDSSCPLFIVEGASDVMALNALGIPAIGRPSNKGGGAHIVDLLKSTNIGTNQEIVVLGEWDLDPETGHWPGREGAMQIAAEIDALNKGLLDGENRHRVSWAMPPEGYKDVRAWVQGQQMDPTCADEWSVAGDTFVGAVPERYPPSGIDAALTPDQTKQDKHAATADPRTKIEVIDSAAFAKAEYQLRWHVKRVLVEAQPAVVGGPKKALKTSLLCDLAISIGSGLPFLGQFPVEKPTRIGFLSGESGSHTIQNTARNICRARGIELADAGVYWGFKLPQLSQKQQLANLAATIKDLELKAIILDPLYLCLLAGNADAQASNLFEMGPLLAGVAGICLDAGATPILCHHNVKRPNNSFAPPELEDLAFAGIQEFARQWLLVGRREKYEFGSGQHSLWLNIGGSVGFSGCWALDINEGVVNDDFSGKIWEVAVTKACDTIAATRDAKEDKKRKAQESKNKADENKVLMAIDKLPQGQASYTKARSLANLSNDKMTRAVDRLVDEGIIEEFELDVGIGKNRKAKRIVRGLRRRKPDYQN